MTCSRIGRFIPGLSWRNDNPASQPMKVLSSFHCSFQAGSLTTARQLLMYNNPVGMQVHVTVTLQQMAMHADVNAISKGS